MRFRLFRLFGFVSNFLNETCVYFIWSLVKLGQKMVSCERSKESSAELQKLSALRCRWRSPHPPAALPQPPRSSLSRLVAQYKY